MEARSALRHALSDGAEAQNAEALSENVQTHALGPVLFMAELVDQRNLSCARAQKRERVVRDGLGICPARDGNLDAASAAVIQINVVRSDTVFRDGAKIRRAAKHFLVQRIDPDDDADAVRNLLHHLFLGQNPAVRVQHRRKACRAEHVRHRRVILAVGTRCNKYLFHPDLRVICGSKAAEIRAAIALIERPAGFCLRSARPHTVHRRIAALSKRRGISRGMGGQQRRADGRCIRLVGA